MWENATKTSAGLLLDAKLAARKVGLTITAARCADGTLDDGGLDMPGLTTLSGAIHDAEIGDAYLSEDGASTIFPVTLYNAGIEDGFRVRQVGLFASDPDGGEVLYLVTYDKSGNSIPAAEESPGFTIDWYFYVKGDLAASVTVEVTDAARLTERQADSRYAKLTTVDQLIDDTTLWYVDIQLMAAGWKGNEAPFTQTVQSSVINEQDMWLVKALDKSASVDDQKAYNKAFGIIQSGTAETSLGSVTFRVLKKPATDITVRLLMRGAEAEEAVPDPENVALDASDLAVVDTHGLVGEKAQETVLQMFLDEVAERVLSDPFEQEGEINEESE